MSTYETKTYKTAFVRLDGDYTREELMEIIAALDEMNRLAEQSVQGLMRQEGGVHGSERPPQ